MIELAGIQMPVAAVTDTFAILAMRGAGKTNTARVMAEQFHQAGAPFVAIDPVGSWWGLRAGRTPNTPGLSIPIFGGRHGDVPLERTGGQVVADAVVNDHLSCVIDLSEFDSEAAKKQFLLDFARRLYHTNRSPLHLFLEEADDYIPQRATAGELQLLRAWENIVRRGRARGLGLTLITQRSAVLAKNVLTQIGTLIVLRTSSPQDRGAIEAWVRYNESEQRDEILASLPSLKNGEAWVWSPHFLGLTKRVQFGLSRTHDSGATPRMGKTSKAMTLAQVDLDALRARMAATIERARQTDPRELRAKLDEQDNLISKLRAELVETIRKLAERDATISQARAVLGNATGGVVMPISMGRTDPEFVVPVRASPSPSGGPSAVLARGPRAVLTAIAQHRDGVTREQLGVLTGYRRSSRDTYVQALRQDGLIEMVGDRIAATASGRAALGPEFTPLPTGRALVEHWRARLPAGELRVFDAVLAAMPGGTTGERIDAATGYRRSSRDTYLQRLGARGLVVRRGREVWAGPALAEP